MSDKIIEQKTIDNLIDIVKTLGTLSGALGGIYILFAIFGYLITTSFLHEAHLFGIVEFPKEFYINADFKFLRDILSAKVIIDVIDESKKIEWQFILILIFVVVQASSLYYLVVGKLMLNKELKYVFYFCNKKIHFYVFLSCILYPAIPYDPLLRLYLLYCITPILFCYMAYIFKREELAQGIAGKSDNESEKIEGAMVKNVVNNNINNDKGRTQSLLVTVALFIMVPMGYGNYVYDQYLHQVKDIKMGKDSQLELRIKEENKLDRLILTLGNVVDKALFIDYDKNPIEIMYTDFSNIEYMQITDAEYEDNVYTVKSIYKNKGDSSKLVSDVHHIKKELKNKNDDIGVKDKLQDNIQTNEVEEYL